MRTFSPPAQRSTLFALRMLAQETWTVPSFLRQIQTLFTKGSAAGGSL